MPLKIGWGVCRRMGRGDFIGMVGFSIKCRQAGTPCFNGSRYDVSVGNISLSREIVSISELNNGVGGGTPRE